MDDLISRQAAIDEIMGKPPEPHYPSWYAEVIEKLPSAQLRKKGNWIHKKIGGWHCSECGVQAPFWCVATTQNLSDYCPNCGVRMSKRLQVGG